ncbi:EMP24/GP25L/P24 family protein [Spironucleus salmonicida]|uniref:EMP24/GP25L/P24 family protein n=1 Tax=Spironucleus salmonicida TaxID=348837 RepID=V6LT76_9EUKA|nr:EMP24/GP25L/P24 family protein [Spironucleus salmonicida]|eukprot:EST46896.1 EMP24/GP25L/P24 family protein [Spironucleus salmonicida]
MLILLLQEQITIDLPATSVECFFHYLKSPAEVTGYYQVYPTDPENPLNISFQISSFATTALFDSDKPEETFSSPAHAAGLYKFCFTIFDTPQYHEKLFFELNVIEIRQEHTNFGEIVGESEQEMTRIQTNYRNARIAEQQLQTSLKSGIWKTWIWSMVEVATFAFILGTQALWIVKLTK